MGIPLNSRYLTVPSIRPHTVVQLKLSIAQYLSVANVTVPPVTAVSGELLGLPYLNVAVAVFRSIMVDVANTFGAPLLAVFLLGMFTRRCTSVAAFWSLVVGTLFTVAMMLANQFDLLREFGVKLAGIWNVTFGTLFTLAFGYLLSFVVGRAKSKTELKGLVAGCGTLGVRASDEEMMIVGPPEEPARWK